MTVASRSSIASPTLEVPFKKLLAPCWMSLLPPCTVEVSSTACPAFFANLESNAFLPYLITPAAAGTATAPSTPKKNLSFKFSKACPLLDNPFSLSGPESPSQKPSMTDSVSFVATT